MNARLHAMANHAEKFFDDINLNKDGLDGHIYMQPTSVYT